MTERFRIILPPIPVLAGFALVYSLLRLPSWLGQTLWGMVPDPGPRTCDYFLGFAAIDYGVYRVVAFHPFYRHDYREWLERTPWTSARPLPVGPVSWVWEDSLMIGALCALCWADGRFHPVLIGTLPLISDAIFLTISLFATSTWAFGYATAFAIGLAVRLAPTPWAFLAAAAAATLLGHLGLRRSLARFPWSLEWLEPWDLFLKTGVFQPGAGCGWPYDQLRPDLPDFPRIGWIDAVLVSLLAAWWIFAIAVLFVPTERAWFLLSVLLLEASFLSFMRLLLYRKGCAPPIGIWGRIVTLRWIIPGFDQVYVGPLCTFLAPWPFLYALPKWGVPREIAIAICCALTLFVALSCKPSLHRWRLTGRHRIVATIQQKTEFVRVG